ncbi:MAG TPA: protein adenylyltransferase SelO family protein, partial [Terracidiphilus sp.]
RRYGAFLDGVIERQARLMAQWMLLGFIHGVMNTDNMAVSGETIDYGPCAFMEAYDPATVFSSIDRHGRYGYGNQPGVALWNLTRLAEALLPLLEQEAGSAEAALAAATEALEAFGPQYEAAYLDGMRRKLGLLTAQDGDRGLADDLLQRMASGQADFTLTFWRLREAAEGTEGDAGVRGLFAEAALYDEWAPRWRRRLAEEPATAAERAEAMRRSNPIYIPRNHLVEEALKAAERQDYGPFEELVKVVSSPFDERPGQERYATPARPEERVLQTFCGT